MIMTVTSYLLLGREESASTDCSVGFDRPSCSCHSQCREASEVSKGKGMGPRTWLAVGEALRSNCECSTLMKDSRLQIIQNTLGQFSC